MYMYGIYHVYTGSGYIHGICMVYTWYIPCIIFIVVPDGVSIRHCVRAPRTGSSLECHSTIFTVLHTGTASTCSCGQDRHGNDSLWNAMNRWTFPGLPAIKPSTVVTVVDGVSWTAGLWDGEPINRSNKWRKTRRKDFWILNMQYINNMQNMQNNQYA